MIPLGNGDGPPSSKVMIVGEMWGHSEMREHRPFAGGSGEELNRMLHEAGLLRSECFVTNVVNAMPPAGLIESWIPKKKKDITSKMVSIRGKMCDPIIQQGIDALRDEIKLVKPNLVIAAGNTALWALTGMEGILKWRGSQLYSDKEFHDERLKVIPIVHPAMVFREWSLRRVIVQDLRRCKREKDTQEYAIPEWKFITRPTLNEAIQTLDFLFHHATRSSSPVWIDFDLETKVGHIDCAGLSWSKTEAICIPLMSREDRRGYWPTEEVEAAVVWRIYRVLRHPNVRVRGQNLLYDCQYTYRHWHFVPRVAQDTMIAQHSLYCGMRKSLDFQASLYCEYYKQWKPDKTAWKAGG